MAGHVNIEAAEPDSRLVEENMDKGPGINSLAGENCVDGEGGGVGGDAEGGADGGSETNGGASVLSSPDDIRMALL